MFLTFSVNGTSLNFRMSITTHIIHIRPLRKLTMVMIRSFQIVQSPARVVVLFL